MSCCVRRAAVQTIAMTIEPVIQPADAAEQWAQTDCSTDPKQYSSRHVHSGSGWPPGLNHFTIEPNIECQQGHYPSQHYVTGLEPTVAEFHAHSIHQKSEEGTWDTHLQHIHNKSHHENELDTHTHQEPQTTTSIAAYPLPHAPPSAPTSTPINHHLAALRQLPLQINLPRNLHPPPPSTDSNYPPRKPHETHSIPATPSFTAAQRNLILKACEITVAIASAGADGTSSSPQAIDSELYAFVEQASVVLREATLPRAEGDIWCLADRGRPGSCNAYGGDTCWMGDAGRVVSN
ncbi:hypothetical protein CORC01_09874 [Colletotrichum orchidophilum]|uniref:Uncharacterized protein n=1 Tax=Colletotrichum orchidophilum TaxID=1209926 RepID=A0A1G4B0G0_9PEZI|nr:uncharacterized protein CORC01_09874 [Colletotrichum orchidophilum]OHE94856.1 hypothetical protein CORC01_09874 [Colletotrichum orchidophilum]